MNVQIRRMVLKIGSSSLNQPQGGLDLAAISRIVRTIARLRAEGIECILVSSGAVAAGIDKLGLTTRPTDIVGKQAVAAVGQGVLVEKYALALAEHDLIGAQVLLSRIDLADAVRYRNAQNTLERLLRLGIVPIINENDTVAIEELCFGDNDRLSALVAGLVHADLLVVLTDVDGLYSSNPKSDPEAFLIREVEDVAEVREAAGGAGSHLGTGGMITKLMAAEIATRFGIGMLLLNSARMEELVQLAAGLTESKPYGTYFHPAKHRLSGRKRWIAYAGLSEGSIVVDDGAAKALIHEGKSLLAKGIVGTEGNWDRKELVRIVTQAGEEIARGLAELSRMEIELVRGRHSAELTRLVPDLSSPEIVHRDNLTLIGGS